VWDTLDQLEQSDHHPGAIAALRRVLGQASFIYHDVTWQDATQTATLRPAHRQSRSNVLLRLPHVDKRRSLTGNTRRFRTGGSTRSHSVEEGLMRANRVGLGPR
jgi:hypothetical protein